MLDRGQEVDVLSLRVHGDELLVKVCLDALVQLQVHILLLSWKLNSHDDFSTLVDSQFADFRCRDHFVVAEVFFTLHFDVCSLFRRQTLLTEPVNHFFKGSRSVGLHIGEGERARQLEQKRLVVRAGKLTRLRVVEHISQLSVSLRVSLD